MHGHTITLVDKKPPAVDLSREGGARCWRWFVWRW